MRRARWRSCAAIVLVLVLAAPAAAGAAPQPSASAPVTPPSGPAILDLVGCIQGSHHLTVEMLIDQSASLKVTDPQNRRVDAAQAALDGLVALAGPATGGATQVDVSLAAFSNEYVSVQPWTQLDASSAPALHKAVDSFRSRHSGTDTDFINALTGARASLAERSASVTAGGGNPPCKAVLLFTDGQYDLAVRSTPAQVAAFGATKPYAPGLKLDNVKAVRAVEALGRTTLCRTGGLADGLRSDAISLLTVALSSTVAVSEQRLIASASAGTADGVTCGRPTETPPGAYFAAGQVDELISRFDEITTRIAGGTLLPAPGLKLCGTTPCPEGTRTLILDRSVRRVHLLALAPGPGLAVSITAPGGTTRISAAGPVHIGAVTGTARSVAGRGFAIDLEQPGSGADWAGSWAVSLLDTSGKQVGKPATLNVYVLSDVNIVVRSIGHLQRGTTAKVDAALKVPKGVSAAKLIRSSIVTLRLVDPVSGRVRRILLAGPAAGPFTGSFETPADYTSSSYTASVEVQATLADGGSLVARSVPLSLLVSRSKGSIQIAPSQLVLPSLTGSGKTSADLLLFGGGGPGCVWFGPAQASAPPEAGALRITYGGVQADSPATCIKVGPKTSHPVSVEVAPAHRATGTVHGVIVVHERVDGATGSITKVPFVFDMSRGVNQQKRLVLVVGLLLGGLLLPLVLLMLINQISARFQSLDVVQGAVVPIAVAGDRLFRTDGPTPKAFRLSAADFSALEGKGGPRRFRFGGVEFRARASANPFGPTIALAVPEGGGEKVKGNEGSRVALDPYLAGSWIFLLDPDRTAAAGAGTTEGDLLVFLAEGETSVQIDKVAPDVVNRLPAIATRLSGLLRTRPAKAHKARRPKSGASTDVAAADVAAADPEVEAEAGAAVGADAATAADQPPSTPLGFSGTAAAPPPASAPAPPADDDPPAAPPVGFSGGPRPAGS